MFEITFEPDRGLLTMRLRGFWSEETLAAFAREAKQEIGRLIEAGTRFDSLSDARDFPVQSPHIAKGLGEMMAGVSGSRQGRLAVVVASMLNKLQAEMALGSDGVKVFLSEAEARAWLADPA